MRYLTSSEVIELHRRMIEQSGGTEGVRDHSALDSAVAEPQTNMGARNLYRKTPDKAAALGVALIKNRPFVDGNKRIGHAATEVFLRLNGYEIWAPTEEQDRIIRSLAAGQSSPEAFAAWLQSRLVYSVEKALIDAVGRCFSEADRQAALDALVTVPGIIQMSIVLLAYGDLTQLKSLAETGKRDFRDVAIQFDAQFGMAPCELNRRSRELGLPDSWQSDFSAAHTEQQVKEFVAFEIIRPFEQINGSMRCRTTWASWERRG